MRLLAVEDDPDLAQLIGRAFRAGGFAIDVFGLAADALEASRSAAYDAMILDLGLPDDDGLNLLRHLRRQNASLPILILTARGAPEDRVTGLDSGADDYVLKPFHMAELISRIKALLRRPNLALGVELRIGNIAFDSVARQARIGTRALALTSRELALLELLMRRADRMVPKQAIEDSLYGFDVEIGSNAVEVAVHRLRRKLAEAKATPRIHTFRGIGYMLAEQPA
jgi:DNA-binding response OmpR family regulator